MAEAVGKSEPVWAPPPAEPRAEMDEVHVWRAVTTPCTEAQLSDCLRLLSPDEREKAAQFKLVRDRDRYVLVRWILRKLLGRYLCCPAGELEFNYNRHGKPSVPDGYGGSALSFNLSHSARLAVIAVTQRRQVGVDIEYVDEEMEYEGIAERFYQQDEIAAIRSLPSQRQHMAFYQVWVRKEALAKALGTGLSFLDDGNLSTIPDVVSEQVLVSGDAKHSAEWTLRNFFPGNGYVGSVAVEGRCSRILYYQWHHIC